MARAPRIEHRCSRCYNGYGPTQPQPRISCKLVYDLKTAIHRVHMITDEDLFHTIRSGHTFA
ncbi:hypothetical protein Hanom_Chr03g00206321 [Helianthus anomalus]